MAGHVWKGKGVFSNNVTKFKETCQILNNVKQQWGSPGEIKSSVI